jgi:transposase
MSILAVDMGKYKSVACIFEPKTGKHRFQTLPTSPQAFHDLLVAVEPEVILIEIGPVAGWVVELAKALGLPIRVANTGAEPWRWKKVKRKTDKDDALKLIRLYRNGELSDVHMPPRSVRQWRSLIAYRQQCVKRVTAAKNRIRALVLAEGQAMPSGKKAWNEQGRKLLRSMGRAWKDLEADQLWRGMLLQELEHMEQAEAELGEVEQKLNDLQAQDERVQRLKQVPKVGPRLAEVVVSLIDDPKRFTRGRQVAAYAGLTPRQWESGTMQRQGHISRGGSGLLRKMLVQISWQGIKDVPWMREVYERARGGSQKRKKVAIVAVARRLLVRLWAMLRDGSSWQEETKDTGQTLAVVP